jgi:hypothetical protein
MLEKNRRKENLPMNRRERPSNEVGDYIYVHVGVLRLGKSLSIRNRYDNV